MRRSNAAFAFGGGTHQQTPRSSVVIEEDVLNDSGTSTCTADRCVAGDSAVIIPPTPSISRDSAPRKPTCDEIQMKKRSRSFFAPIGARSITEH
jgi:hypothetical protein